MEKQTTISLEIYNQPDAKWNSRLKSCTSGTLFQTSEFAKFTQQTFNSESNYLTFLNSTGKIVGQILILKMPASNSRVKSIINNLTKKPSFQFRWTYGPVLFDEKHKSQILDLLQTFFKSQNFKIFGSEHPLQSDIFHKTSIFNTKQWATFIIDLSKTEEEIFKKFSKNSVQKNLKRSNKHGVTIKEISRDELCHLNNLRKDPINKKYTDTLKELEFRWDSLHDVGWNVFLAFYENQPVGGISISHFNGYITEQGISRSTLDYQQKLYSQDLLKWNIIQWGIRNKMKFFDLAGVNPTPSNKKEEGIFNYKKKWGGDLISYNLIV